MPFNLVMVNQLYLIRVLLIASFLFSFTICHTQTSTINWVAIPDGGSGTCGPTSSYPDAQVCYGIEYTPTNTGVLTSYTMGFLVECPENFSPSINSVSCVMTDNSNVIDGCAQANLQLFVASANNGNLAITAGVPVIIHEVCMNFHFLDSIDIEIEAITGISFSVNLANGDPVTESAPFDDFIADYSVFGLGSCEDTTLCSVYFSSDADKINLDENALGNIIHADPSNDVDQHTQSFDIYDEDNLFCTVPGGKDDVTIDMKMIHTYDINGNGIIDEFVGSGMKLIQDNNGLSGIIPFGNTLEDESSSGDVRGYEVNVEFADHISITAGQLNVLIKDVNNSNPLFESASLEFYGPENFLYGKIDHHGFYNGPTDLTGNCQITAPAGPQQIAGNGVSNIDNKQTIDLSSPCIPSSTGSTNNDTLSINASLDGGLHPDDLITGFRLTVLGEDIAAPSLLDDGSNSGPEDGVVANRNTSTQTTLLSSLLGYQIDGCVFANEARPPISLDVTASHNYLSIGDSIRYNVSVINNDVATLNPVDVQVELSSELINVVSEAPGVLNGQEVDFYNLDLIRLDTVNYFVRGAVSPSSPTSDEILDIVEGSSDFEEASYHHDFTPWVISNINPRSGSEHWYASTDSALVIKYLNLSEIIIPTEESILSFWHDYDTEVHQDGGQVEISVDNGITWVSLADHFTSNGYNDYINGNTINLGFSGNSGAYIHSEIDLSPYALLNCRIRFKLFSDIETGGGSWSIDDIVINDLRYKLPLTITGDYDTTSTTIDIFPIPFVVGCTEVYSLLNEGQGTLRRAVACAEATDTITLLPSVYNDTIRLSSMISLNKNLVIDIEDKATVVRQESDETSFEITAASTVSLSQLHLIHLVQQSTPILINHGSLHLDQCLIKGVQNNQIDLLNTGGITIKNTNAIQLD